MKRTRENNSEDDKQSIVECVVRQCNEDNDEDDEWVIRDMLGDMHINELKAYVSDNCVICSDKRSKSNIVAAILEHNNNWSEKHVQEILDTIQTRVKSPLITFRIFEAHVNRNYNIPIDTAVERWEQDVKKAKKIYDAIVKYDYPRPTQVMYFILRVIYYLKYGVFNSKEAPDQGATDMVCPYTLDGFNIIISLVKTNECLCQCYTDYIIGMAEEFGVDDLVKICLNLNHIFVNILQEETKDLLFAQIEPSYEEGIMVATHPDNKYLARGLTHVIFRDDGLELCTFSRDIFLYLLHVSYSSTEPSSRMSSTRIGAKLLMLGLIYKRTAITNWIWGMIQDDNITDEPRFQRKLRGLRVVMRDAIPTNDPKQFKTQFELLGKTIRDYLDVKHNKK